MIVQNKQPKGMYILGLTEVFERISYYTLAWLLVLYASDTIAKGGLGWTKPQALSLVGFYTLAAFTLPLIGAFIADKVMGVFRAAMLGAALIIIGHATILLASHQHVNYVFIALSLTATGTAFFKPSMPTLLGRLYKSNDVSRDAGFKLYYMGINIGGIIAGFAGGILVQHFGYQIALSSAGLGMLLGLSILFLGKKHLIIDDKYHEKTSSTTHELGTTKSSELQKRAFNYLMLSFVFYAVWALIYNIAISGTLSVYIENYTQKTVLGYNIPTPFFNSLESIGIVIAAPLLAYIFHVFAKKKKPFHFFSQMNLSLLIVFLGIAYFTHLTHIVSNGVVDGVRPFSAVGVSILILAVSVSEVLISPVMMAAISLLAPLKYKAFFQAFYLAVIGTMGLLASKIGAISLDRPYETFMTISIVAFVAVVLYVLLRKKMVGIAMAAAAESHHEIVKPDEKEKQFA